jgi:hypothetical protein
VATTPIPVRIPEDWLPRIDRVAARLGTNRARLIAFCAQTFAQSFESRGVSMMPPDWPQLLAKLDGRRVESRALPAEQSKPIKYARAKKPVDPALVKQLAGAHPLRSEVRVPTPTVASPSDNKPAPHPPASPRPSSPPPAPTPVLK